MRRRRSAIASSGMSTRKGRIANWVDVVWWVWDSIQFSFVLVHFRLVVRRKRRNFGLGIRQAEERELGQEVVVRFEAVGADLSVGQEGHAGAEDIVGGDAAVGIGGRLGAVVAEDVGEHGSGGRGGLVGGVAAAVLQEFRPGLEVVRHVVGRVPGVVFVF